MMSLIEGASASPNAALVSPKDIVTSGLCIGCGSCVAQAAQAGAQMRLDRYGQFKPVGSSAWLARRSPQFSRTCPFSSAAKNEDELAAADFPVTRHQDGLIGRWQAAYVGHVEEDGFRANGSSGGMVTWVASELLRRGMVDGVAHVVAMHEDKQQRLFGYRISRTGDEVREGAKSRYYPVELSGIVAAIRDAPGRYAVVGIPCFIKAIQLLRASDPVLRERIAFTLGLFCGHMKSARMAESFAWQMDMRLEDVEEVEYRLKNSDRPANWYTAQLTGKQGDKRSKDWWHLADGDWGAGFFQNSACNFCDDVVAETADIAFGDAWVEPYASDGRGTNVVIVRSQLLYSLLSAAIAAGRLHLQEVDSAFIERTQAAGFRQRREGLAFRLSWPRPGLRPNKRVLPQWRGIATRRKLIYIMRHQISAWSHVVFWLARLVQRPGIYIGWAKAVLTLYHGVAYSRGRVGRIMERAGLKRDHEEG